MRSLDYRIFGRKSTRPDPILKKVGFIAQNIVVTRYIPLLQKKRTLIDIYIYYIYTHAYILSVLIKLWLLL